MRTAADKAIATHSQRMKEEREKGGGGGSASGGAHKSAQALGMSAALGHGVLVTAPPPPPPPADGAAAAAGGEGGAAPQHTLTPAQIQETMKFMAAAAAAQPGIDPFLSSLMPGFLAAGTDPFLNLPGTAGNEVYVTNYMHVTHTRTCI